MPNYTNCPGPVGITSYASASIGAVPGSESRCKASATSPEALERETRVKQRPFGRRGRCHSESPKTCTPGTPRDVSWQHPQRIRPSWPYLSWPWRHDTMVGGQWPIYPFASICFYQEVWVQKWIHGGIFKGASLISRWMNPIHHKKPLWRSSPMTIWFGNDSSDRMSLIANANQCGHILIPSFSEFFGTIQGVHPNTKLTERKFHFFRPFIVQ